MKIQPTQIWLPRLGRSIKNAETSRDAMRAFGLWRDESVVWMLPEIQRPARWRSYGFGNLAVPAEEFDRVDIVHVTQDGRLYAPTVEPPSTVDGLLEAWLNARAGEGVSFIRAIDSITVNAPNLDDVGKSVTWSDRTVRFGPGAYYPFTALNEEKMEVEAGWPPQGFPSTVSPEAESTKLFPSKKLDSEPLSVMTAQGDLALHVFLQWPEPLRAMMPLLSSLDDLFAQARMADLARKSVADLDATLRAAATYSQPYLFQGHSTLEHIWLRPLMQANRLQQVFFEAEEFGLVLPPELRKRWDEATLRELVKDAAWQHKLNAPVSIRRAWGAVGLFWTLLLDQLKARRAFSSCERCQRVLSGKRGKRFCSRNENADCFNRRRAADQHRSRCERR